jgi:hypothetical protein
MPSIQEELSVSKICSYKIIIVSITKLIFSYEVIMDDYNGSPLAATFSGAEMLMKTAGGNGASHPATLNILKYSY